LQHGPITVSELIDEFDIPQETACDHLQNLETAGLVEKIR
jgi:predicted ArsR family transcriptional regulator